MDRENTPLKQRQKRSGGNTNRRSSTSSNTSAGGKTSQSGERERGSNANASTGGASARAFRSGGGGGGGGGANTRTRSKTVSSATAAPPMILAKHPPTILKAPPGSSGASAYVAAPLPVPPPTAAMTGLYIPDAPSSSMKASPRSHLNDGMSGNKAGGYLQVNTRQGPGAADPNSYAGHRHSTGGEGSRTLYHPPPSSSPSVKKMGPPAPSATPPPPSMRPHTPVVSTSSASHYSNIVPPTTTVKLINAQYHFATDLSSKLANCLELTNFTVVGVLGFEGVGKSTVMSLLHPGAVDDREQQQQGGPRDSSSPFRQTKPSSTARTSSTSTSSTSIFSPQSFESLVAGNHETSGVDMAVSHDPAGGATSLVLLDTQPMLSSSMLCELLGKNEPPRFGALTPEQQVEVASYQLAVFLCSICHYVVIVHDGLADLPLVRFLQQVEQKLQHCRLPNISGGVKEKHVAKLVCVVNRLPAAAVLYKEQELLTRHVRALESAWPHAFHRTSRNVSHTAGISEDVCSAPNKQQIPVLMIPHKPSGGSKSARSSTDEDFDGTFQSKPAALRTAVVYASVYA